MVSVQSVYETVKNLANKDQKGFVSPEVFNSFAKLAQLNIYSEMFEDIVVGRKLRRQNVDGPSINSMVDRSKTDLSPLATTALLQKNPSTGVFNKPLDFSVIISCNIPGLRGSVKTIIHLIREEEKLNHLLASTLSAPTKTNPVALISDDIEVFPTSLSRIDLTYYRVPKTPLYNISVLSVDGAHLEVFNEDNSQDFELPVHYEPELVAEVVKMLGIEINDKDLYSYGQTEETQA
jgi:hypothetical protein|tara:strand:- start:359 stop:1063 length:705 start_codon:yes stop_codon:yes gene_type:complete